jgi:RNA polymerase sigma factor (sigma-70 family)
MNETNPVPLHQDSELAARLREKSPDAAKGFAELYQERLISFCCGYLGDRNEAEDAFQEITFKVLHASEIPESLRPWLFRIARNQCLNMIRARARRPDRGALPSESQVEARLTGQLTALLRSEAAHQLRQAVAALPEEEREALRLRYVEELSRAEIAAILDVPESVVKARLFDGLQSLRRSAAESATSD